MAAPPSSLVPRRAALGTAAALGLAACARGVSGQAVGAKAAGHAVLLGDSVLGVVVTEGDGRLVYLHTADTPTSSACTDACAQEWLPLLRVEGTGLELLGVDEALVGELRRPEGVQLTLAGHPLYHRVDDSGTLADADAAPHRTDGTWYVITPNGEPAP